VICGVTKPNVRSCHENGEIIKEEKKGGRKKAGG
jgi:hypothetical protein